MEIKIVLSRFIQCLNHGNFLNTCFRSRNSKVAKPSPTWKDPWFLNVTAYESLA